VGFLFVALQVNNIQWGEVPLRHAAAARTLTELAAPLIIGLCAIYPGGKWTLGGKIAGFAVLVLVVVFLIFYVVSDTPKTEYDRWLAWGSIVPAGLGLLMLVGSYQNNVSGLRLIGWICVWELASGVVGSWLLLVVKAPGERIVLEAPPGGKKVLVTIPAGGRAEVRFPAQGGVAVTASTGATADFEKADATVKAVGDA
jgi:hypothetical protein